MIVELANLNHKFYLVAYGKSRPAAANSKIEKRDLSLREQKSPYCAVDDCIIIHDAYFKDFRKNRQVILIRHYYSS